MTGSNVLPSWLWWAPLIAASLLFSNAVFHVVGTYRTKRISPGVRTGVLLYVPLAMLGYWKLVRSSQITAVTASLCALLGGSYHLWAGMAHRWRAAAVVFIAAGLLAAPALAHPGSGIVVDEKGQVYFVDMVSGVWRLDPRGALAQIPGPAFHWMTLDAGDRFAHVRLPSGAGGDFARLGSKPTLILTSDFPIALGRDGNLYYPSHGRGGPVKITRFKPSGESSPLATLPATTSHGPLEYLNGIAAGPDGSFYTTEDDAIRKVGADGQITTVVENVAALACTPAGKKRAKHGPVAQGLDVADDGTIYAAVTACRSVIKVTPDGHVTLLPQLPDPWAPTGVARFGGDLYVLEFKNPDTEDRRAMVPRVRKIAADGTTKIVATVTRK